MSSKKSVNLKSSFLLFLSAASLIVVLMTFFLKNFNIGSKAQETQKNNQGIEKLYDSGSAIDNKWNLSGSFAAHPGYDWDGLAEEATWRYNISIKEALKDENSVGSVNFWTDEVNVTGQIRNFMDNYPYWKENNIAAVGVAEYDGLVYNFMLLYSERAVWLALSNESYEPYWVSGTVWGGALREYELHSSVPDETFLIDYRDVR